MKIKEAEAEAVDFQAKAQVKIVLEWVRQYSAMRINLDDPPPAALADLAERLKRPAL